MSRTGCSPLAEPCVHMRTERPRARDLWGVCIHTTGSGVWRHGDDPLAAALRYYLQDGDAFPHYLIGLQGEIMQIASETVRAWHAGIKREPRIAYASGAWRTQARRICERALAAWDETFQCGDHLSPLDLFLGTDPNDAYLGVELVPLRDGGYTAEAVASAVALVLDVWARHADELPVPLEGIPGDGWAAVRRQGHLVGHEDLQPLTRWSGAGGWDPGSLGRVPFAPWDWRVFFAALDRASGAI